MKITLTILKDGLFLLIRGVDIMFSRQGLTEAEGERERQKAIINLQHFSTGGG